MKRILFLLLTALAPALLHAQCDVSVTTTPSTGGPPLGVTFHFQNSGTFASNQYNVFDIQYGDGASGTIPNGFAPQLWHVYTTAGSYTIQATVSVYETNMVDTNLVTTLVCTDNLTQTISVAPSACAATVSYDITSTPNTLPVTAQFTANTFGSSPLTYSWNFDDGSTSTAANPSHSFTTPDNYHVCLTTTSTGCSFTNCTFVLVTPPCTLCGDLAANFTANINNGLVHFENTTTGDVWGNADYTWDLGDGTTAIGEYTSHTYAAAGTYACSLTVSYTDTCMGAVSTCSDTYIQNVVITTPGGPSGTINGMVLNPDSLDYPNAQYKVYLIKHDAATNTLTEVASVLTTGTMYSQYYSFPYAGLLTEPFLVKAQWINTTGATTGPVPTYHQSSLYWSGAVECYPTMSGGWFWDFDNIVMQMGLNPTTGPGFIGGDISLGANKGANAGVPDVLVLLRDASGQPIQFTYTDADGNYAFSNVPNGTYSIYPENMNYATIPANSITVSAGATTMTDVDFNQDNSQMNIAPRPLGISSTLTKVDVAAYPNPANEVLNISLGGAQIGSNAHYELSAPNGQVVCTGTLSGNGTAAIRTATLAEGVYFLRVAGSTAQGVSRVVITHR